MNSLQLFWFFFSQHCLWGVFRQFCFTDALQRWELTCVTTASSSTHAIAVPLVSWDCFGVSALLSQHHIPSQALTDSQCLGPTVALSYEPELVLAVRFLLRRAGSTHHIFLTGMFLINALMMQESSAFSIPYAFVHPKGRARNGSGPRAPGCCCQSCFT